MLVTYYDCYNVLSKVYKDKAFIKQALSSTAVEERNRKTITKICYGVLDKDITLEYILSKCCEKPPKLSIKILLKIGAYAVNFLKTPPHAVTDNLVKLAKKMGKGGVAGFINAVMRKISRGEVELLSGEDSASLSVRYSCPEFIVKKLINGYGKETAIKILGYDEETQYIRFQNDGGDKYLTENSIEFEPTVFENLYKVKNFKLNQEFYDGLYTFQSIGSVAICNALTPNDTLLDCCSAPGGKAVLLSKKFKFVTATDVHEHRVELIKSYATRMNCDNITAKVMDATVFNPDFENNFSAVLCDAPCSGTGVMKDNPDIKLNRKETAICELKNLQLKILTNVSKYVKSGGELLYSTCSILPEENDKVIKSFLDSNSNFKVENVSSNLANINTEYGLQFLPHLSGGAGFYLSKLKKI